MRGVGQLLTASVLTGVLAGALGACAGSADEPTARAPRTTASTPTATATASCDTAVRHGPLPGWARTGFEPADQPVRYVIGEQKNIVGVVFGYPLVAGTRQDGKGNKILWVGRHVDTTPHDLQIRARLEGTSLEVRRSVSGGPGPSLIDLPRPGCWTLDLTWGGGSDRMAVPYTS